ncbi:MAG: hypothetical protein R3E50_02080 [Halioglobus sp.]
MRIAILSLLLGALAVMAGLTVFFAPPTDAGQAVSPVYWNATTARVEEGVATIRDGEMQLHLNERGQGTVQLASKPVMASAYPYIHLSLEDAPQDLHVVISWNRAHDPHSPYTYIVENELRQSLWLAATELREWTGELGALRLYFFGRPGDIVRIRDFSIFPPSPARQLLAIFSDLTEYESWNRAAMNSYAGVAQVSSFYPVALALAFLLLSLAAYATLLLLNRARLRFNWHVVGLIFLACWISLDLVWQNRLLHQLADTYRTFFGKSSQEKLAAGPDASLYTFVAAAKRHLSPRDARVFVSSSDEYQGQRAAYFLYPFNVFWPEPGRDFPPRNLLRSGDYVVLVRPTTMRFDRTRKKLALTPKTVIAAELVFAGPQGTVVRIL